MLRLQQTRYREIRNGVRPNATEETNSEINVSKFTVRFQETQTPWVIETQRDVQYRLNIGQHSELLRKAQELLTLQRSRRVLHSSLGDQEVVGLVEVEDEANVGVVGEDVPGADVAGEVALDPSVGDSAARAAGHQTQVLLQSKTPK